MRFGNGTLQVFISDRRRVWLFCCNCGEARLHDTFKLADKYGADAKLELVRQTIKCPSCQETEVCYFIPEAYHRLIIPNRRRYAPVKHSTQGFLRPVPRHSWFKYCQAGPCGFGRQLSDDEIEELAPYLPEDFKSGDARVRLLCERCGKEGCNLVQTDGTPPSFGSLSAAKRG